MFRRIGNLIRGFFALFVGGVERRNPEALLELERENLRKQIASYNQGLAAHAGLCERLMSQVKRLESEERDFHARTVANLRAGNRDLAGQQALRLQTVERELEENDRQLEQAETTYRELLKSRDVFIKAAQAKIESLRAGIDDLKIKRATAELMEMASGTIGNIGGSGDTLNRLSNMIEEERQKAAGRARVARDSMNIGEIQMKEEEQRALADQALADFAAREGIVAATETPAITSPAPSKMIGPGEH